MEADNHTTIVGNLVEDPRSASPTVSRAFGITEEPLAANPRVAAPCGRV
jgi:hypothetical protein